MAKIEQNGNGEFKIIFDGVGMVGLPTLYKEEKIKVEYTIKTPEKALYGDSTVTLSPGHWYVSVGYVKEDYTIKDELFGDRLMKKDTVVVQPIRIA